MNSTDFYIASKTDIPFISETYNQNIDKLHGINRTFDDWGQLLIDEKSTYYIVLLLNQLLGLGLKLQIIFCG